ncbi:MAG: DUF1192 domain-containing protein [Hyphomicrobiaceae bacterium]
MDWDEAQAKQQRAITVGEPLARLSVGELEARVAALEQEIVRIKAEIAAKKAHTAAASALFKNS